MHRAITYTGQVPRTLDVLDTNLFAMIGLGRLAMDVIGTTTAVTGLACTPTTPASMAVNIGAGAIYALENVDDSAYSSVPANTTDQIVKQGLLFASDALQLSMTAPTGAGTSVIYLVEAAYQDVDTGSTILNYFNAANPSTPYTGPNNSSAEQPTTRAGKIAIQAKAGVAASSPVAPSVDPGYVPLYYVTIAQGQTSITSGNIAVASGAPFLSGTLASLSNYLTIAAAAATYVTQASLAASIGQFSYDDQYAPGSHTVTAPAWANHAEITVIGGGGGGSGSGSGFSGGGGGAGGYSSGIVSVTPGANYSVTVGAGGSGAASGSASNGAASSFSTLATANGGGGGNGSGTTSAGGPGGTASGSGLRNFTGGYGGDGNSTSSSVQGGNGANGVFGGSGRTGSGGGFAGVAPGAGGGGSWGGSGSGGAGAPGAVLIKWIP